MSRTRISFTLDGNRDSVLQVVRRMLDTAGFTEVAFETTHTSRGAVDILVPIKSGQSMPVSAEAYGEWAVHGVVLEHGIVSDTKYSVTHTPTGFALPVHRLDEETAISIATALAENIPAGQIHTAKPPLELVAKIKALVEGILWP